MTDLQAILYTIFFPTFMLFVGYIFGRISAKPVIYHGHLTKVPDKPEKKDTTPKPDVIGKVNKAFASKRLGRRR